MGGLSVGVANQLGQLMFHGSRALFGFRRSADKMPYLISNSADMLLPFYEQFLDVFEVSLGARNIDMLALRKIRKLIDKRYDGGKTPRHIVKRDFFEMFQKAIFRAETGEPEKKPKVLSLPTKIIRRRRRRR